MSLAQSAVEQLKAAQEFFNRSTRNLREEDSTFVPVEGLMTTAQQVAHTAHTVRWFMQGAFRPEGFDHNWEEQMKVVMSYTSLAAAKAWFDREVDAAVQAVAGMSDAELSEALPAGPVMGGQPRFNIFGALTDHTAHHRGALTVYARLKGIVPPMPYMEM